MRKVDACSFVQVEFANHCLNSFELHFQTQSIKVAVARMLNCEMHIRRAMVAAHAAREFVAYGDATAADEIRIGNGYRALLQPGRGHQWLPRRTRRITSLDSTIKQWVVG